MSKRRIPKKTKAVNKRKQPKGKKKAASKPKKHAKRPSRIQNPGMSRHTQDFFKQSPAELAKLVGRSVSTIRRWKREGIPTKSLHLVEPFLEQRDSLYVLRNLALENMLKSGVWSAEYYIRDRINKMTEGQLRLATIASEQEFRDLASDHDYYNEEYGDEYGYWEYDEYAEDIDNPFWYHD